MADNPIAISQKVEDAEALTINLSRRTFSDFIFSLSQTPSEETRHYTRGFELTKESIKVMVDKLGYYIKTNNDLVKEEFTIKLGISQTSYRTIYSKEHFFDIGDSDHLFAPSVQLTLSYLVAFKRTEDEKSLEKQVVDIQFFAGRPGRIRVSIRSTEFTWPSAIFSVISNHINEISAQVEASNPIASNWLSAPAKYLAERPGIAISARVFGTIAAVITLITVAATSFNERPMAPGHVLIFDPQSQSFKSQSVEHLVDDLGWRQATDLISSSDVILKTGIYERPPIMRRSFWQVVSGISPTFLLSSLLFLTVLIMFFREAQRVEDNNVGRIVIKSSVRPSRSTITSTTGVAESLFYGVIGGLIVLLIEIILV